MNSRRRLLVPVLLCASALSLAACDVASSITVQNDMDRPVLVRVLGTTAAPDSSTVRMVAVARVVEVPPHERAVVILLPFAPELFVNAIEALDQDCAVKAAIRGPQLQDGAVFVVGGDWKIAQRHEGSSDTRTARAAGVCAAPDATPLS